MDDHGLHELNGFVWYKLVEADRNQDDMEWKTYSVFISSTFADMHSERDFLKMFVFPQINEELKKRSMTLRIIDLRWGINTEKNDTEDVENRVMQVCFDEIDRSRPFFIGLLGNRYGWIPPEASAKQISRRGVHQDSSITSMEIEYGFLLRDKISGCLFMERDVSCLNAMDMDVRRTYDDALSPDIRVRTENPRRLKKLKEAIRQHLHQEGKDDCYQTYCPTWNGVSFDDLTDFGEKVKHTILREIETVFPVNQKQTPFQNEQNTQDEFLHLKLAKIHQRQSVNEVLVEKIEHGQGLLTISGPSGSGKSCIYATLVDYFRKIPTQYIVLYHTTAAGMGGRELNLMLQRWNYQLETYYQLPHVETASVVDAATYFAQLIKKTPKDKKLLLFVDAIDGFLKTSATEYLSFYPRVLSQQWMMICTGLPEALLKPKRYHKSLEEYDLPPLERSDALSIINQHVNFNGKELYPANIDRLLACQQDGRPCYISPLWITIALSRILSLSEQDFAKIAAGKQDFNKGFVDYVNEQIDHFPIEEEVLFSSFLQSLSQFYGVLPTRLFNLLSVSYNGLDESTLAILIGDEWNALDFATIRNFLYDFIAEQGDRKSWQIMHEKCRQRINQEERVSLCQQIAAFYIGQLEQQEMVSDNVCHYLIQCMDRNLINRYFSLSPKNRDRIIREVREISDSSSNEKLLNFLFEGYSTRKGRRRFFPKSLLFWELKEIIKETSHHFNKAGKHENAIQFIDAFYAFLERQKFNRDAKTIIYIMTEPERERAAEYVLDTEEQEASFRQALSRAKIRGPLSLLIAPIAHKYYNWKINKLKME